MGETILMAVVAAAGLTAENEPAKPRIFVAESRSWSAKAGDRPQTVEIMKTFSGVCSAVAITANREDADYLVMIEHEAKHWVRRDNKFAVFDRNGILFSSGSTPSMGFAVRYACKAILKRYRSDSAPPAPAPSEKR